jgi:DNA adenine methylase
MLGGVSKSASQLTLGLLLPPPLKWAGGKRWLAPCLAPYWSEHSACRLVEPFCGGLAVTLSLEPERALLNDRNPHLICFYSWLKRGLMIGGEKAEGGGPKSEVRSPKSKTGERRIDQQTKSSAPRARERGVILAMENEEKLFYAHRQRFNELLSDGRADSAEAAALFYYLNRTGFNGLCRFNSRGEFNVPFGEYKKITYVRDFTGYRRQFENWEFTSGDFESVQLADEDFVYADPPYDVPFTQYSKEGFDWNEQVRAAEWLARHPGAVILSNQATNRIVALYEKLGFKLRFLDAPRRISCTGDRTPAREVLAFKNVPL